MHLALGLARASDSRRLGPRIALEKPFRTTSSMPTTISRTCLSHHGATSWLKPSSWLKRSWLKPSSSSTFVFPRSRNFASVRSENQLPINPKSTQKIKSMTQWISRLKNHFGASAQNGSVFLLPRRCGTSPNRTKRCCAATPRQHPHRH